MTYQHIHRRLLSAALCLSVGWLACLPAYAQELAEPAGLQPGDRYHRVFVTSETYLISTSNVVPPAPGTFGGLAAADWNVNSHAHSAGLITDWNGSDILYRAILSDFTAEARTRLSITGPVYNMANEIIANDFEDFWDGSLINPIRYEEKGAQSHTSVVWTGTTPGGFTQANNAFNWSNPNFNATVGSSEESDTDWILKNTIAANTAARLYGLSPTLFVASSEVDPVLPDETSSDPNRDPDDLNGVIDTGTTGPVTFQPIVWEFIDVPSGWWFDPLPTEGFLYDMSGGSLFTDILDFPSGFSDPFDVWAEGSLLGSFGPGDSVDFVTTLGHGVSAFAIHGINPLVDPTDPLAFPLQLAFDTPTADFQMQGFTTDSAAAVPEPSALILALVGLLSLGMRRRR